MNRQETTLLRAPPVEAAVEGVTIGFALLLLLLGAGMAVAGVYILCGTAWALIAGSVPVVAIAAAMLRGLQRGA